MKIACIGCGVMGSAFMSAIAKKVNPSEMIVCDKFVESANALGKINISPIGFIKAKAGIQATKLHMIDMMNMLAELSNDIDLNAAESALKVLNNGPAITITENDIERDNSESYDIVDGKKIGTRFRCE